MGLLNGRNLIALAGIIVIIILIAVGLHLQIAQPRIDSHNYNASDGLTSAQKLKAIDIALEDPDVKGYLDQHVSDPKNIEGVKLADINGGSDFMNASGLFAEVSIKYPSFNVGNERVMAIVDLNKSKVMDVEWYSYHGGLPMYANAIVPPGACWYHVISMAGRSLVFSINNFIPTDARIYTTIVDGNNLSKWINGSPYSAAILMDPKTGNMTSVNGTGPITQYWGSNVSIRSEPPADETAYENFIRNNTYYLVLYNSDKNQDASISFSS